LIKQSGVVLSWQLDLYHHPQEPEETYPKSLVH